MIVPQMESRLPKPKIVLTDSINFKSTNTSDMNKTKASTSGNEQSHSNINNASEMLKKAQSVANLDLKSTIKDKPMMKENLARSKTMSSITTRTLKRPATTNIVHAVKKPFIKPVSKAGAVQQNATSTGKIVNSTVSVTAVKNTQSNCATKPNKWDIKGRLAHTTNELSTLRGKYKDTALKLNMLQEQVNTLEANTNVYKLKVEEYETLNKRLDDELKELKVAMSTIEEERENLNKRLLESRESFNSVSKCLEEFKQKCLSQEALLLKHTSTIENQQTDLEKQERIIKELSTVNSELQSLVHTMDKDRRCLHNAIQELKGNIRVFCRVRPRTSSEIQKGKMMCIMNFVDESTIEVGKLDGSDATSCSGKLRGMRQEFSFDKVFPPNTSQQDVFEELALLVQSALEGYNVCVFAYGQTGSGKTFTMEGSPGTDTEGMIPRTVRHIFKEMKQFQLLGWEYRIEASFLEIYNEHIVDLLDSQVKTHEIRMTDSKGHDLYVSNLKIEEIHSPEELHECLLNAQRNRAVAATLSNERSSRSHSVTRIKLIGLHKRKGEVSIGNLNLVDLAGSERLKAEESARIAETKNINKSLANLGNVILALLKKQEHIPYRNSKLTHLLMPSLGGNSKTLMLLNISPLNECYNETLNSLRFANSVNSCKIGNVKRTRTVLQQSLQ
ncbi:protein claret segregational-like isoform X1 [Hylaeus volcanicus]|uniref:protein claret segregational-like isoform X1 n=2 Tax=Hylaeus volcanicus TaxID=313075 RepID=UPI0023B7F3A2|nr:protein claret segregational-like isoform X1 [Hylaeus volcanicus]